jgi:hypothetical protein
MSKSGYLVGLVAHDENAFLTCKSVSCFPSIDDSTRFIRKGQVLNK